VPDHYRELCQYGYTHAQCPCFASGKPTTKINCNVPDEHAPVFNPQKVYTIPTAYQISCLPSDYPGREHYTVTVKCAKVAQERWEVQDNTARTWNSRSQSWTYAAAQRFTFDEAMVIARAQAPYLIHNGRSVADALRDPRP
jgi:hypothetical protein